jgi:hypothetical protein
VHCDARGREDGPFTQISKGYLTSESIGAGFNRVTASLEDVSAGGSLVQGLAIPSTLMDGTKMLPRLQHAITN